MRRACLKFGTMQMDWFSRQLHKIPARTRAVVLTCAYGVVAGTAAVAFQVAMNLLYQRTYVALARGSKPAFLAGSFLTILVASLLVGWLLSSFCPQASGSGIPQLKLAFWKEFGLVSWRVVWVKFVAGIVSIGGGCSLGREGPSVHLAGGLASNLAGLAGEAKQSRRNAAAAGAAAGLAAAFNTPLAAMTFVLEEIVEDLNSRFLGGVLLASVVGALVVHGLIGRQPAFAVAPVESFSWKVYALTPLVAAAASLVGVLFQKLTIGLRGRRKEFERVPAWVRPVIGGVITWALGSAVFVATGSLGVFSLGYADLSTALSDGFGWKLAGLLVAVKLAATIACYGFGGCGGIFSPTLFLGGMSGVFLAGLFGLALPLMPSDHLVLAIIGMSACLGAVVRAPVTSILIVFEMTHEFSLVPALMLGTLVSQAISRRLCSRNFYEDILVQDGHNLEHVIPPRDLQSWQQLPVSAIANFQPVIVESFEPAEMKKLLRRSPYKRFPVVLDHKVAGLLTRAEAEAALAAERPPRLEPPVSCLPSQTVRELQGLLIESNSGLVMLLDRPAGKLIGLVTLHDLLRSEVSIARQTT